MWKRGRKRSDDEPSGGDAVGDRPSKRAAASQGSEDDGIVVCEISKNRRVSVRSWQGKIVVDIREFYVKEGQQLPGKKGISLPMDQWKILRSHIDDINEAVNENS